MEKVSHTNNSAVASDALAAQQAAETFVEVYEVTLVSVEQYLEELVIEVGPDMSGGYKPWLHSVRNLTRGAFLLSKQAPITQMEKFQDALRVFSFNGAVQFLNDVCNTVGIQTNRTWAEEFKQHVMQLSVAANQLHNQKKN
jgi:hypothetical protein